MSEVGPPPQFDLNIPEPYLIAIGRVCASWSILESVIDLAIAKLAAFDILRDPRGAILTAHMTWPLKMDILEALVNALLSQHPELAKFDAAKPSLKKAQEGRNWVVHGQWVLRDAKVSKLRITARSRLKSRIQHVKIEDIETVVGDIARAGHAVIYSILLK